MRIGIYHGYELTGSGSNEYTRYLSRALANEGHEVAVLCREPRPEAIAHVARAFDWDSAGRPRELFRRDLPGGAGVVLHRLPHAEVRPVYVTDKQREGNVRAFCDLADDDLRAYHDLNVRVVSAILRDHPVDVLHANHLVYQPVVAAEACRATNTPFVIYPHGSSIEYTLRPDARYREPALRALLAARGVISGSEEVCERILELYPGHRDTLRAKTRIVGVGVDTSLFRPVARGGRREAIARVRGSGPYGGKPRRLVDELRERLSRGELQAVGAYHDAYDHEQPDAELERELEAIDWDGAVLLYVGALAAGKGVHGLIAALPAILTVRPDAHLLIVGSGTYREVLEALVWAVASGDAPLLDALVERGWSLDRGGPERPWRAIARFLTDPARRAELLGAGRGFVDRVHFLGRLDHDLLRHVFPCADVAVFPSLVPEAYPLVLMESLANGVPAAVTDFSGFRNGLASLEPLLGAESVDRMRIPFGPEWRIEGIVRAARRLLDGASSGDAQKQKLREIAVEHFDWQVRARQMADVYRRMLAEDGVPSRP